jgi:hypothetical protein
MVLRNGGKKTGIQRTVGMWMALWGRAWDDDEEDTEAVQGQEIGEDEDVWDIAELDSGAGAGCTVQHCGSGCWP